MCFGKKSSQPAAAPAPAPPPQPTGATVADTSNTAQRLAAANSTTMTDPGKFGAELGDASGQMSNGLLAQQ